MIVFCAWGGGGEREDWGAGCPHNALLLAAPPPEVPQGPPTAQINTESSPT